MYTMIASNREGRAEGAPERDPGAQDHGAPDLVAPRAEGGSVERQCQCDIALDVKRPKDPVGLGEIILCDPQLGSSECQKAQVQEFKRDAPLVPEPALDLKRLLVQCGSLRVPSEVRGDGLVMQCDSLAELVAQPPCELP